MLSNYCSPNNKNNTFSCFNDKQLFNLQCWALTCQTFLSVDEWLWLYRMVNYTGEYEFIFFN